MEQLDETLLTPKPFALTHLRALTRGKQREERGQEFVTQQRGANMHTDKAGSIKK